MAEINPIQGPLGPNEDPHKRDLKKMGTPEKFKESYRVQAVGETDAESKKKRKRKEEKPEEDTSENIEAPSSSPATLEPSPYQVQKAQPKQIPPKEGLSLPSSSPTGSYYTPSSSEQDPAPEEPAPPTTASPSAPSAPAAPQQLPQEPPTGQMINFTEEDLFEENPEPDTVSASQSSASPPSPSDDGEQDSTRVKAEQSQAGKKPLHPESKGSLAIGARKEPTSTTNTPLSQKNAPSPSIQKEEPSPATTIQGEDVNTPTTPLPPPLAKETGRDLTAEELGLSWQADVSAAGAPTSSTDKGDSGSQKGKKDDDQQEGKNITATDTSTPFVLQGGQPSSEPLPVYTTFSPELLEMFDKMVGTISVLEQSSGQRTTTLTLTSANFTSSPFYGAQIIIEEDVHLAAGQYNIKLIGSPEAAALFQEKTDDLLAAFQSGNYNFKVQRIETAIQSPERPFFRRKEKSQDGGGSDGGSEEKK